MDQLVCRQLSAGAHLHTRPAHIVAHNALHVGGLRGRTDRRSKHGRARHRLLAAEEPESEGKDSDKAGADKCELSTSM
jgi:hypothetical protein